MHNAISSQLWERTPSELVRKELDSLGIGNGLISDGSRPTTFKKRYLVENQSFSRQQAREHNLDAGIEDQVIAQLKRLAPGPPGIVISDFVYGVVTPRILGVVQELAKEHNLLLFR